jgi:hypothetical protein
MIKSRRLLSALLGVIALISAAAVFQSSSYASEELVKKLVGRWEGTAAVKNNPHRWLVIESVKPDGDQWTGEGRWGSKEEGRGMKVQFIISVSGSNVSLAFDASQGNDLALKLVGDDELTGLYNHAVGRRRVNAQINLKKVT